VLAEVAGCVEDFGFWVFFVLLYFCLVVFFVYLLIVVGCEVD